MTWFDLIKASDDTPRWGFHEKEKDTSSPQKMYIVGGDHCCEEAFEKASNLGYVTDDSVTDCPDLRNTLKFEIYNNLKDTEAKDILDKIIDDWLDCENDTQSSGRRSRMKRLGGYDWRDNL